jgi:hypothetical protein
LTILDDYTHPFTVDQAIAREFIPKLVDDDRSSDADVQDFYFRTPKLDQAKKQNDFWFIPLLIRRFEKEYNTELSILGPKRVGKSSLFLRSGELYEAAMGRAICNCIPTVVFHECISKVAPPGYDPEYAQKIGIKRAPQVRCKALDNNSDPDKARTHAIEFKHRLAEPGLMPWKEKPCRKVVEWVRDHIFYKNEQFFQKAPNMPLGELAGFDESGVTHDAHRWQERRSRLFREMTEIWGKWRFVVMYIAPDAAYIQRSEKLGLNAYIIIYERQKARVYGLKKDYLGGIDTRWRDSEGIPRNLEGWSYPKTPGLWVEYNRVKDMNIAQTVIDTLAEEGTELANQADWVKAATRPEDEIGFISK